MKDLELAKKLFASMKEKGFDIRIKDYSDNSPDDEEFDETAVSFQFYDMHNKEFISIDFLDGDFYRISGYDSSGGYYDEVDGKKYT